MGETAAVKGNRATHLKPFEYTESLYNCNHYTGILTMTHTCTHYLHVVDHCLQLAKLVLTANTAQHTTTPPTPTLSHNVSLTQCVNVSKEASLRGTHVRTSHHPLTCCFPRGRAGLRGGLSLCRAQNGTSRCGSSCSDGSM